MHSESTAKLAKALAAAQAEMKNATLNKVNPHFKSQYADLAAIRDAVIPALAKHGLAITQMPDITEDGFVLITRLMHDSGEWISSSYPLPTDLGKPQQMGSAQTYARRYSLAAMAGVSAEEDDDANNAQEGGSKQTVTPKAKTSPPPPPPTDEGAARAAKYVDAQIANVGTIASQEELDGWCDAADAKLSKLQTQYADEYKRLVPAIKAKQAELSKKTPLAAE